MDALSPSQKAELKADLEALKTQLETLLAGNAEAAAPVELDQTRVGRLSRMDAMQMQQQQKAEQARNRLHLQQTLNALAAVTNNDYGYCQQCDEPIGFARLKVRPEAPLCISCQEKCE